MTTIKTKLGLGALLIAFLAAGVSQVKADELWAPDRATGQKITIASCTTVVPLVCGQYYEDDAPVDADPIGEQQGEFN